MFVEVSHVMAAFALAQELRKTISSTSVFLFVSAGELHPNPASNLMINSPFQDYSLLWSLNSTWAPRN
jgi:hypothetical protein